jgi:4-hydroxythreonine-4-phosphate dehydrogenase
VRKPLIVTMGDPAGIGPEVVAKALTASDVPRPVVVAGDVAIMRRAVEWTGVEAKVHGIADLGRIRGLPGTLNVLEVTHLGRDFPVGCATAEAGIAGYSYVDQAARLLLKGRGRAMVTAPLNKASLHQAGIEQPGHTEMLAELAGVGHVAMMLASHELRVVLVTVHVALRDAIASLSTEAELRSIELAALGAQLLGIPRPRIAVAGLNPHAGEDGLFGTEEERIIEPAIGVARDRGLDVSGPWSPDTVFMRARDGEFDFVVAQYHDQGLIPVKYLGLDQGVNVTLGLPFVRTSVDHGTAFDIAGTGRASEASLLAALDYAERLCSAPVLAASPEA